MSNFFRRNKNQFPTKVDLGIPNWLSVNLSFSLPLCFLFRVSIISRLLFSDLSPSLLFFFSFVQWNFRDEKSKIMNNFNREKKTETKSKGRKGRMGAVEWCWHAMLKLIFISNSVRANILFIFFMSFASDLLFDLMLLLKGSASFHQDSTYISMKKRAKNNDKSRCEVAL